MRHLALHTTLLTLTLAMAGTAAAQDLGALKSAAGGLLGQKAPSTGLALPASIGSVQNAAGVLGYCQSHGYLPSATDTLKEKLLGKFGGAAPAQQDAGYQQGLAGVLQGGNGQSFSLGSLKGTVAKKFCQHVADKAASSFLGH